MIFFLNENPNLSCRPSKFQKMFASRACRKSVMFGKVLSQIEMKSIVNNLSQIKQPWNCPHGRPTMRHLFDLKKLSNQE
jgi:DNA mismatch repair protein PMS2